MTDSIDKIGSAKPLLKPKKLEKSATPSMTSSKTKDQLSLSVDAKLALEKKQSFIDHLIAMPEIPAKPLEREYDYSSPKIFKAMAKKLLEEGF